MANRWCDGLARYGGDTAKMLNGTSGQAWAAINGGAWVLSAANPRTGPHHLRFTDANYLSTAEARRGFGAALGEVFVGAAFSFGELPNSEPVTGGSADGFYLGRFADAANNTQLYFYMGTDGSVVAYRYDSTLGSFKGRLIGRSQPCIGAGAYNHIEMYAKAGASNDGAIEVRVGEQTVLNLTEITTATSGAVEFSQFATGCITGTSFAGSGNVDLADVYCNDTVDDGSGCDTFIGDCKSALVQFDGDTAQADFLTSAGTSGYQLLDLPIDDGGTIYDTTGTARSDFTLADLPANLTEILTARPFGRVKKDDAGTALFAPTLASNGDKAIVTPQPITTGFAYHDSNVPFDPDTGAPWTPAALAAALGVMERTA